MVCPHGQGVGEFDAIFLRTSFMD